MFLGKKIVILSETVTDSVIYFEILMLQCLEQLPMQRQAEGL